MSEVVQSNEKSTSAEMLEKMKCDPDECFKHPREVLLLQDVSDADKKIILANWFNYLDHISESEEEGMGQAFPDGRKATLIQEVRESMEAL